MASQSHRICVADSSSCRHLSQVGSSISPSLKRCPLRWQCPVSNPSTHLSSSLFSLNRSRSRVISSALKSVESQRTIRRNVSRPSSLSNNKASKNGCLVHFSLWFLSWFIFSILNMEATCSSETSVDSQRTPRRNMPEDGST
jgi:hypothetical protein